MKSMQIRFCVLWFVFSFQLVFHALQLLAYSVLAILIMRLKLFLTPHLCIMASLVCSKQVRPLLACTYLSTYSITQILVLKHISLCVIAESEGTR